MSLLPQMTSMPARVCSWFQYLVSDWLVIITARVIRLPLKIFSFSYLFLSFVLSKCRLKHHNPKLRWAKWPTELLLCQALNQSIRRHSRSLLQRRYDHFTPGTLYSNINFKLHTWLYTFIPWWTFNQEEQQRKLAEEREKRAAAAERRLAALAAQSAGTSGAAAAPANSVQKAAPDDNSCSCCFTSLAGKVPFHRYNYKYCSTTCMHLHSEMLQDDWGNCMLKFTWFLFKKKRDSHDFL